MNVDGNNEHHKICFFVVCIVCFCTLSFLMSFQAHCQSYYSSGKTGTTDTIDIVSIMGLDLPCNSACSWTCHLGRQHYILEHGSWSSERKKMEAQRTYKPVDYKLTIQFSWMRSWSQYFSKSEMDCHDYCLSFKAFTIL